jgi:hypothetical protein
MEIEDETRDYGGLITVKPGSVHPLTGIHEGFRLTLTQI